MQRTIYLGLASLVAIMPAFATTQSDRNYHTHPPVRHYQVPIHKTGHKPALTQERVVKHEHYVGHTGVDHKGPKVAPADDFVPTTMTRDNALHISAGDKTYAITIYGEVFVTHSLFGGAYNLDGKGRGHFAQQTQLQTARVGVTGNLLKNWTYAVYLGNRAREGNPDDNSDVYVRNAFIAYTGWPKFATLTIGKQNQSWGVDDMHSDNNTYGASASMMSNAFAPPIGTGASLHGVIPPMNFDWYAGIFHTGVVVRATSSSTRGAHGYQNESRAVVARLGWAPIHDCDNHV